MRTQTLVRRATRAATVCALLIIALVSQVGNAFSVQTHQSAVRIALPTRHRPSSALAPSFGVKFQQNHQKHRALTAARSPLFQQRKSSQVKKNSFRDCCRRVVSKLRRAVAVFWTVASLWLGSAGLAVAPSHASTTAMPSPETPIIQRLIPKGTSFEKIVDRYVKDHMFDDEQYDPVESAYREAYDDVTVGTYPRALKEVTTSVWGQEAAKLETATGRGGVLSVLQKGSRRLQDLGLSEAVSNAVVLIGSFLGVPFLILIGGLSYANSEKRRLQRLNKKRYGDDYSLDATIKVEEEVEAPDDEDDEDDDEDEDDDDEDE